MHSRVKAGRRGECSLSLLRPTGRGMSGGSTFDLSVVTFSRCLVILTFDINYLRNSRPCCLRLEMLFKVWWEDLRKAVTADSTQGTLVCTAEYQRTGTSLSIFPQCLVTSLAFTLTLSECPHHARARGCRYFKWLVHTCATFCLISAPLTLGARGLLLL